MRKKGEITSQQIVILVVLIASFAILLFFLFRLNLGEETDKELCRNSVLLKGKSVFKDSTLLNCKKSYVCLTADGNCDSSELLNPEIVKVETENEIYKELANEMRDCWWMFGEGKVNYIGDDLTSNNYCSICSQVVFDDSVRENIFGGENKISEEKLYNFLGENKLPGSEISYLNYLYSGKEIKEIKEALVKQNSKFGTISLSDNQLILMGIKSKASKWKWRAATAGVVGAIGAIVAIPISGGLSIPIYVGVLVGGTAGGVIGAGGGEFIAGTVDSPSGEEQFLIPTIISPQNFNSLNCEEVITLS